ncbi:GvpL/GvpF family gas vesicle protein [Spartinivicinus ruber]|uniref:GvpL/GvpF family gas vesicle protein n=1 Tax=Spartinivicinus ruber TaxID=2683272 RepID=UPI0013D005C3|nr:GvpL/GvpF family gas vesicle protein [Spartinivicinus ruber]
MTKKFGLYLYAITSGSTDLGDLCGIDNASVYLVSYGDIAAVVSDMTGEKVRPQRKNLASHQHVLKFLMSLGTPLPIKFGVIAKTQSAVDNLLEYYQDSFTSQLESLKNTAEMGLRLSWSVPNVFEYLVNTNHELKTMRDQILSSANSASRDDMIEVGYRFSQLLESERQRHTKTAQAALLDCCLDIKANSLSKESEVMNLACLVSKDKLALIKKTVYDMANLFNDDFLLDYNGPWAPHNFVDIRVEYLDPQE